jgi:methionyl-tRNA synthetase
LQEKKVAIHICGTDEYGTATEIRALELGKHPEEVCEENSRLHKEVASSYYSINNETLKNIVLKSVYIKSLILLLHHGSCY